MFSASYPLLEGQNYGFVEQSEQWWRKKRSTAAHLLQFLISLICAEFDHCRITYIMRHNGVRESATFGSLWQTKFLRIYFEHANQWWTCQN